MNLRGQVSANSSFMIHRSSFINERMCCMKLAVTTLAMAFVLGLATSARAQEPELVNEIVARVNNDIITRTDYLAAIDAFKDELKHQMQNKSQAEIKAEFERLRPTVLNLMIEDMLLEQKAKELGIDVEAE